MKRLISVTFFCALALLLCGCVTGDPVKTTAPSVDCHFPRIHQKLTWDAIHAIPVKTESMTTEEMRELCIRFFEFSKTALWTPDQNWTYIKTADGKTDDVYQGQLYGGLPYIGTASGNIYRLMDYIDEQTGVVDMTEPMKNPKLFGNQCSLGSYWGWARVINSASFGWTFDMVHSRGFLRVGPYTYDDKLVRFQSDYYETSDVIRENGAETMLLSYAAMHKADGLITYTTAGHAMMCASEPVVVLAADGTIDGNQSYLYITDQHSAWVEGTNDAGDTYQYKNYIRRKFTFHELMAESYIPFTFAEFLGTDPVEPTECTFSHTGDTVTLGQLNEASVTANYGISDIYALVLDANGDEIARAVKRADVGSVLTMNFNKTFSVSQWSEYTAGGYAVQIVCQLGTGERPVLYTGKLIP